MTTILENQCTINGMSLNEKISINSNIAQTEIKNYSIDDDCLLLILFIFSILLRGNIFVNIEIKINNHYS